MHQIPPTPAYFRVRIRRRLAAIGAVPVKNTVYALPAREDTREDFEWLVREIGEGGGEASLCEAAFIDGVTGRRLRAAIDADRNVAYSKIVDEADRIRSRLDALDEARPDVSPEATGELMRLKQRIESVKATDFFQAAGRAEAEHAVSILEFELRARPEDTMGNDEWTSERTRGRTWVTRRGVRVDRIASSWLIRRFIAPDARFKFVEPQGYRPAESELRFDMFEGEFTHEGERCTFETLLDRFGLGEDAALAAIGEIIHDLDLKEERYGRAEGPGLASLLSGITISTEDDAERIERGGEVFGHLYAHLRKTGVQAAGDRR